MVCNLRVIGMLPGGDWEVIGQVIGRFEVIGRLLGGYLQIIWRLLAGCWEVIGKLFAFDLQVIRGDPDWHSEVICSLLGSS